ncbi:MAG: carboxylating nicotinate-nucleotide diphosphorylase [Sphingomonas sp.]|nr:MAG: carboxylating nicotinate-nucleotide diphosphorylase [Sphingomonas sp.]
MVWRLARRARSWTAARRLSGRLGGPVLELSLPGFDLSAFVEATLAEDLGGVADAARDLTATACLAADARLTAVLDSRDSVVVAGLPLAEAFFRRLDPDCAVELLVADGDAVVAGTDLLRVTGNARALLAAERSALNTLQHLTGIATLTRRYVEAIAGTGATLLDTRKTLPGLRALEKYAVRMGGGTNHRMGLWDAPMVKDNHIAAAGGVTEAVSACKAAGLSNITVEVDRLDQIEPAIAAGADRLLLDNMKPPVLREAVALVAGRVPTEASGGVNLDTIRGIAETGVTFVSVGRLTQSAPAADVGMDYLDR